MQHIQMSAPLTYSCWTAQLEVRCTGALMYADQRVPKCPHPGCGSRMDIASRWAPGSLLKEIYRFYERSKFVYLHKLECPYNTNDVYEYRCLCEENSFSHRPIRQLADLSPIPQTQEDV